MKINKILQSVLLIKRWQKKKITGFKALTQKVKIMDFMVLIIKEKSSVPMIKLIIILNQKMMLINLKLKLVWK